MRTIGHTAVIGMQWGDEGKGKVVDMLAKRHSTVVRCAGGGNAGHTVAVEDKEYVLHLIPSGIIEGRQCFIGNGVVANLDGLKNEIDGLREKGILVYPGNLYVSERTQIITPYHLLLDLAEEIAKGRHRGGAVGTTMQGIGPAYQLKVARTGMRMIDLVKAGSECLEERIDGLGDEILARVSALKVTPADILEAMDKNDQTKAMTRGFRKYFDEKNYVDRKKVLEAMLEHKETFAPYVSNVPQELSKLHENGRSIMFEGAQGTLLDIDHGTYPHVTSSNTTIGGIFTGSGIYLPIEHRLGILKAYTTRVGNGEFPTELKDEIGERIRQRGREYGATTGRPRRVGWIDLVIAKYAARVNGINEIALTKLDVLDEEASIGYCTEYEIDGKKTDEFPASEELLRRAKPVIYWRAGWKNDTSAMRKFSELPFEAQLYAADIQGFLKVPIKYISIGKKRDQVIELPEGITPQEAEKGK